MSDITVRIKPTRPLDVEIDLDALSFSDAIALTKLQDAANDENALLSMMDIISKLIGQDAKTLPLRHVQAIVEAVMDAIKVGNDTEKN
jgi:hypothetical protein